MACRPLSFLFCKNWLLSMEELGSTAALFHIERSWSLLVQAGGAFTEVNFVSAVHCVNTSQFVTPVSWSLTLGMVPTFLSQSCYQHSWAMHLLTCFFHFFWTKAVGSFLGPPGSPMLLQMTVFPSFDVYHSLFSHSPADAYLGCFHVLAIVNSAALNNDLHVSF